ncbi:MAG: hypothetical protein ACREOJ_17565 [Gemmatimonadaceae bacterium]
MRMITCLVSALVAASPALAQQTVAPGNSSLHLDRIRPYTDTITLLVTPPDSAQRVYGSLVRRVERASDGETPVFRETQHYVLESGEQQEVDTLDVSATTLAPVRVVENGVKARHTLRLDRGRLVGTEWLADSGERPVDAPVAAPFFHGMTTEALIAALPLAEGQSLRLPVGETPHPTVRLNEFRVTGRVTLRTAAGPEECLVVQESKTTVAWISAATRHLVRLHWTLPNGTSVWKLPRRDAPFASATDLAVAARLAAPGDHS